MPDEDRSPTDEIIALLDSITLDPSRADHAGVLSIASLASAILMAHQASTRVALALVNKSLGNEAAAEASFAVYEESTSAMHRSLIQALKLASSRLEKE